MAPSKFKFPDDGRLIRRQDVQRMRIPGSITVEDFREITRILGIIRQDIEDDLEKLCGGACPDDQKPKELHIRLNESDKPFPLPIFVGWIESEDVRARRLEWNHPDPGLHRFGDDVYSEIYGEALNYASNKDPKEHFRYRDWAANELLEKRAGEKATDPKAGNTFQTCLAMVIEGLATGTLVVGFRRRPEEPLLLKTQEVLKEWARDDASKTLPERNSLIDFLKKFELGGPRLANSNWWDFIPRP
jgi:hypothetical protein